MQILNSFAAPAWCFALGRIVLALIFILAGFTKITNYAATAEMMANAGLQPVQLLLPLTILLELAGGLLVAFAIGPYRLAALALALFTIGANIYFHDFWNFEGQLAQLQLSLFFKNVAIAGGLLMVAALPPRMVYPARGS